MASNCIKSGTSHIKRSIFRVSSNYAGIRKLLTCLQCDERVPIHGEGWRFIGSAFVDDGRHFMSGQSHVINPKLVHFVICIEVIVGTTPDVLIGSGISRNWRSRTGTTEDTILVNLEECLVSLPTFKDHSKMHPFIVFHETWYGQVAVSNIGIPETNGKVIPTSDWTDYDVTKVGTTGKIHETRPVGLRVTIDPETK